MEIMGTRFLPTPAQALVCLCAVLIGPSASLGEELTEATDNSSASAPEAVPAVQEDTEKAKPKKKRNLIVVPVPFSNPTLDTGLLVAAAYFFPQTQEQEKAQPVSVIAAGGFYTTNDSFAYAIGQQSYWHEDRWRFTGVLGHADLDLELGAPGSPASGPTIDWLVDGNFLYAALFRKITGKWYAGVFTRYLDVDQEFEVMLGNIDFDPGASIKSIGLGVEIEFDSKDNPYNSYTGRFFQINAQFNDEVFGGTTTYQSYSANFRAYHSLSPTLVLAWEAAACTRSSKTPLWDACRIGLRGFSSTTYLGESSALAQAELRWRFHGKWGAVAFAGAGSVRNSFSQANDKDLIPSYGLGLRFMVLDSQRINLRLDYARSKDSDAVYLSVGEAF